MGPKRSTKANAPKRKNAKNGKASIPLIPPPQSQSQSQSLQLGSQKHHFGRQNRLDDLFSSQSSQPSQKKPKSNRSSMFEEDEGFIYKRMDSSQEKPKSKKKAKQVSTPVSRLNQALDDLPDNDLNDSFDSIDFDLRDNRPAKRQKGANYSDDEPEVVKLSSPIRPRYEDQTTQRKANRNNRDETSSDDYVEQVSHHKIDLTGGEEDFSANTSTTNRRNQANDRRSSYNNRGKRILSIGNGFVGLPHEDVAAKDYYKLLDTSLPEPHRMKQLLIWCFSKQMNEDEKKHKQPRGRPKSNSNNAEDRTVINIAKVIKEELLQDLRDGQINTSWYYRPDDDEENDNSIIANKEIVLPNPLNITTKENIALFTKELAKLKREKEQWKKLYDKNSNVLKNLNGDIDGKFSEKDMPKLKKYVQEKHPEIAKQVLPEKLIGDISLNHDDLKEKFLDNLEDSIDKLYAFTHQLHKANEVIDSYKSEKLNPHISELTRNYVNKTKFENFQPSDTTKSLWPVPSKPLGVKELLKGIAQLDYSLLSRPSAES